MPTFKSKLARYNSFCCEQVMPVPVIPKCAISVCLPIPICEVSTEKCIPQPPPPMIPTQYPWPAPLNPPGTSPCYYKPSVENSTSCEPCANPPSYPPPGTLPQRKVQILNYPPLEEPTTGTILTNITGSTPSGYLPCDGFEVSRITYANLFSVVGIYYGEGDNITTFNVPNLEDQNGTGIFYIIKT
jgi:hypothetical protein